MKKSEIASAVKLKQQVIKSIDDFEAKTRALIRTEFEQPMFFRPDSTVWMQKAVIFYPEEVRLDCAKDKKFHDSVNKRAESWNKECDKVCHLSVETMTPSMVDAMSWGQSEFAPFYRQAREEYLKGK